MIKVDEALIHSIVLAVVGKLSQVESSAVGGEESSGDAQDFVSAMRLFRRVSKMSQRELGLRAGIHQSGITRIETGQRVVSLDEAVRIARVFGTTVSAMLGEGDDEDFG